MSGSSCFLSDDHLLRHYLYEIEHFFKNKYKDYLQQYKKVQQHPSIDHFRSISWKTFHLRFMIHLYLNILSGNHRISSCYIHHNVFQLNKFLTPERREKHSSLLQRHVSIMKRLLERIWEKIYSNVNYHIYVFYNI